MKTYLINLWDTLRASFWFLPGVMALAVVLLGFAMPPLDDWAAEWGFEYPQWVQTTTGAARSTLSTIVGAMMAVTGTVFSITIVTLSLTSQQYGPRLLRTFMHDLATQITLGVFLSTGLYCLLVLKSVDGMDDSGEAPHLSVALAVVFSVLSMIMLIVFFHHISMLIQAPRVVEAVANDLDDAIERLFPQRLGDPPRDDEMPDGEAERQLSSLANDSYCVVSRKEGYIQAIDGEGLLALAVHKDVVVKLKCRPGDFLRRQAPLAEIWGVSDDKADSIEERLNDAVIVGMRRTPRQDVECAIDELVEVAVRALSPGINDPFTAVNCVDRLGTTLARLARRKIPTSLRCDSEGRLRVVAQPVRFPAALDAALNQIRQHARRSVAVTMRLLESLEWIARHVERSNDRAAVLRHAEMTMRNSEEFPEGADREQVSERFSAVQSALAAGSESSSERDARA